MVTCQEVGGDQVELLKAHDRRTREGVLKTEMSYFLFFIFELEFSHLAQQNNFDTSYMYKVL